MTRHQIKAISVNSAFKVGAVLNAILTALLGGAIALLQLLVVSTVTRGGFSGSADFGAFSLGVICIGWLIGVGTAAIFGGITFALGALFYNLTARYTGGLEVTLVTYAPEADPLAGQWDRARY